MEKPVETTIQNRSEKDNREEKERKKLRSFFAENFFSGHPGEMKNWPLKELMVLYRDFLDADPSAGDFARWVLEFKPQWEEKFKNKTFAEYLEEEEILELWKSFLFFKLPQEITKKEEKNIEREVGERLRENPGLEIAWEDYEIPLARLEQLHAKRPDKKILGLHLSNQDYRGGFIPVSQQPSCTVVDGQTIEVPPGYVHYSLPPKVYKEVFNRGEKVFLYFVEGAQSEQKMASTKEYLEAHRDKNWIATARPLPILFKIELTLSLEKELGLERV